jgi:hypothetical protein
VEEEYSCDSSGIVKVTICNRSAAYRREYTLGRWSNDWLKAQRQVQRRQPRISVKNAGTAA